MEFLFIGKKLNSNIFYFRSMKPILTTLFAFFLSVTIAKAQSKDSYYLFDSKWNSTTADSARYVLRVFSQNDTCWQYDFYNITGPLVYTEQYRDKKGEILHGAVRFYNKDGRLDSMGVYRNGKKHGDFYKLVAGSDSLIYKTKYVYEEDSLIETIDARITRDTTTYGDEKESEFPGSIGGWREYLTKNLKYPERAINADKQGSVRVLFMVDTDGQVIDPYIAKSVEISLDMESLRMIRSSGKWIPGFQNGRNVKTYKLQPIVFRLE